MCVNIIGWYSGDKLIGWKSRSSKFPLFVSYIERKLLHPSFYSSFASSLFYWTFLVQGYNLPPITWVLVNIWAMGRDPNTWEKPLQFDPHCFMQHHDIDVHGWHFELLPFGIGKRTCPWHPLVVIFVQIVLAWILQIIDWSIPNVEEKPIDMSETYGLTLRKTKPLCVMAHPRLQAHFYHWFYPQVYQLMCNYSWHEDPVLLKFKNLLVLYYTCFN
jgi:hypothetical protein